MFLKHTPTHNLVEVLSLHDLWDPCQDQISGRFHAGEELQEPETFVKSELRFPSGEALPLCWRDPHYREATGSDRDQAALVS
ncbi:hypothetical protein XM38_001850 [Halomicronema hongdechloris C2206]|uniref:Acetyltransferase n=1 Tax=Halomicronema hongdechloris C2206 TaxID=1641165 RepID=A0A1Z3HG60_9CYAN|nr:acetyltransferase [Halomicronema hongdechloris]ASC69258.1 hypothetical protein XM38_001850 [Halomicronema hongdechloris C2206]